MTEETLTTDDYPYDVPNDWTPLDAPGEHLAFQRPDNDYAVELLRSEGTWKVLTSVPNPAVSGAMDVGEIHTFEKLEPAFEKLRAILRRDGPE